MKAKKLSRTHKLVGGKNYTPKVKRLRKILHEIRVIGIGYNPILKQKKYKVRFLNRIYDPIIKKIKVIRYEQ